MARPATGSPRWNAKEQRWEARITIVGVGRRVVPMRGIAKDDTDRARRVAQKISDKARAAGAVPEETAETANEWFERYLEVHAKLGNETRGMGSWNKYVGAVVGTKTMAAITPADVKAIRDALTRRRAAGEIGAKRAINVWSDYVKAPFNRAFTDDDPKYGAVRVGPANANPTLGIKPPVSAADQDEDEKGRQALDPAEFLKLVACEAITLAYRRFYAVAVYTGLRPWELYGLRWSDVRLDVARPHVAVQRSRHMKTGEDASTKNKQSRRAVPIHPELRPLLRAMRDEADDPSARVFPVGDRARDVEKNVAVLRDHLETAGIERAELIAGTIDLLPFDVRSLRTTFATWCSKAGYDSAWLRVWLGHKPKGTAERHYVKETPAFEDVLLKPVAVGAVQPFPALPAGLLEAAPVLAGFRHSGLVTPGIYGISSAREGSRTPTPCGGGT